MSPFPGDLEPALWAWSFKKANLGFELGLGSWQVQSASLWQDSWRTELRAWVFGSVRLQVCAQWATECGGGLRWGCRILLLWIIFGVPNGMVSFTVARRVLWNCLDVPHPWGFGTRSLGTDPSKPNPGSGLGSGLGSGFMVMG